MGKKKRAPQRPFNPRALHKYAMAALYPRIGSGAPVYRYTLMIPVEEIRPKKRLKATPRDLEKLADLLTRDFGGLTTFPAAPGYGLRDPARAHVEPEMNYNFYYVVYAAPIHESDNYFLALRREFEDALAEGVISLVERQQVLI
jgi:hypothetical protein